MAEEDIIFGKNRHMFGGIEPSNMRVFESTICDTGADIRIQIPEDTVINGQTLCTVAGAVIRVGTTDYPKDEFDGEYITTVTSKELITIRDKFDSGSRFYAAFPYTTQGVYNRNPANRTVIGDPGALKSFCAIGQGGSIKLYGEFDDSSSASGVMIRKSTALYPTSIEDGELVVNISYNAKGFDYMDYSIDDVDVVNYYSAFTYTSIGTYSPVPTNASSIAKVSDTWCYGYDLDTSDSNPETRVVYPSDVDNSNYPSYTYVNGLNVWEELGFMPKPCMLKYDGMVGEYLNPNDYSKTVTGGDSNVANVSYGGNAMMEWPKIYTKRWEDENGIYHFRCSNVKMDADYDCWCNYDKNNNEIDHFYTAIYPSSSPSSNNACRSLSGFEVCGGKTLKSYSSLVKTYSGSGWYLETIADRFLIQDLLVLMCKSTNTVTHFGGDSGAIITTTGTMDSSGLFACNGQNAKVFGMEFWWGSFDRVVAGYAQIFGNTCLKITPGTHDGSVSSGYQASLPDTNISYPDIKYYKNLKDIMPTYNATLSGYIKHMKTFPYGRIPYLDSDDKGNVTHYECDAHVFYYSDSTRYGGGCGGYSSPTNDTHHQIGAFTLFGSRSLTGTFEHNCAALSYRSNSTAY